MLERDFPDDSGKEIYKNMTNELESKKIFDQNLSAFKIDFDYAMIHILEFYNEKRNEFKIHLRIIFYSADVRYFIEQKNI